MQSESYDLTPDGARLPEDATLMPLEVGQLLVSRAKAVFCRIPPKEVSRVRHALDTRSGLSGLSRDLVRDLEAHGFFGPPRPPENENPGFQIQLTNKCNLQCSYCCTNSGQQRKSEITLQQVAAAARDIRETVGKGAKVAILGGEPLLVPWATKAAAYMVELGLDLTVFTNGTLLTDDANARALAGLTRKGVEVRVSLAGATEATCDRHSGEPRFARAVAGIRNLVKHGGQACVDLMLMPQTVTDVVENLHVLKKNLSNVPFALGILYLGGRELGEHVFHSPSEQEDALDRVAFGAGESISAPRPSSLAFRREGCGCALGRHVNLRSDGAMFPCFKMEERIGDIREMTLAQAIEANRLNAHPARALSTCSDCPLATLCGGGCRSENWLYTGDGDVPLCDPWRVRVTCELLAEDRVTAMDWPLRYLWAEARARSMDCPETLPMARPSLHLEEAS